MEHLPSQSPNITSASERYAGVDIARVIAAFLIVSYHCMENYSRLDSMTIFGQAPHHVIGGLFLWGRVPFFLMLAGYLAARNLSRPNSSVRNFQRTRLIGLGIPYLVWNSISLVLIIIGYKLGASYEQHSQITPSSALAHITGIGAAPADGPLWFVRDLIVANFLAPLLLKYRSWNLLSMIILLSLPEPSLRWIEISIPRPSSIGFFGIGMVLQQFDPKKFGSLVPSNLIGFIICLAFGMIVVFAQVPLPKVIGPIVGAFSILLLGNTIAQQDSRLRKSLEKIAPATFLIFAANVPIILVIRQLLLRYNLLEGRVLFGFFCILPFVICLALIFFHMLLKRKFPKLLFPLTGGR